jgi:hypothetical protein
MHCPIETHQFLTSWRENLNDSLKHVYSNSWRENKELDYFGFMPETLTALFVGTFPVPEQNTKGFFYHSDSNCFWRILSTVTGRQLLSLEDKLRWLTESKMGVTDILHKAQRTDKDCISRSDKNLKPKCFNNLLNLLNDNPSITDIYLTSGGPTSKSLSGKSAGGWLGLHLRDTTGKSLKRLHGDGATLTVQIQQNQKNIHLHYLITPAPQDNKLVEYLRDNKMVVEGLNQINYLKGIVDPKEKYKSLQWAVYLMKKQGLVSNEIQAEIKLNDLGNLLRERRFSNM